MRSVGCAVAVALPAVFVAVAEKRRRWPASAAVSVYVVPVAPVMSSHAAASVSQRCQRYPYEIGSVPVHVPRVAVSVSPSRSVPATCGAVVLTGGAALTVALAAVDTVAAPAAFVAVTDAGIGRRGSAEVSGSAAVVAPAMSAQAAPPVSHRRHW